MNLDELKNELQYDLLTGDFFRLKTFRAVKAGDIAGTEVSLSQHHKRYMRIGVFGKYFPAHRLAFFYMLGRWPIGDIDHINQDSLDNRWENLRECSHAENGRNQKKYLNNTSGCTGIQQRISGNWRARIFVNGKHINLGTFGSYELAATARKLAENSYDFHQNHGK